MTLSVRIKKVLRVFGDSRASRTLTRGLSGNTSAKPFALDVDFEVPSGFTILFGASGSGKTTTLRAISGIVRPDAGRIAIDDEVLFDSAAKTDLPIRARGVGLVFQDLALFPHLTALENVEFGMSKKSRAARRLRAQEMMETLRISHTLNRKPREISGGEAQRVALARALASEPRILLLDEPLSAIDESTKRDIISDLKSINRELRLPIVYVTHSRDEAVSIGERLIVYEQGRVVASGEPIAVFGTPVAASVARLTAVENLFTAVIVAKSEVAGTMTVEVLNGERACRIDVPFGNNAIAEQVTLAVTAGDILLATEEPRSTSLRNRMLGRITTIEEESNRVVVGVDVGVVWTASVTRQAVRELQLVPGKEVWLAFKTHSCHLIDRT